MAAIEHSTEEKRPRGLIDFLLPSGHSVWDKVWIPFIILFVITAMEFLVAFTVPKGNPKTFVFVLMTLAKAFYITGYFMHMRYERASMALVIISPMLLLMALFVVMWYEGAKLFQLIFGG
ncbi:MAG: cytochrome C oxidase subunit IV family protein [Bacteroidia bacterium]|nr:cytochrome C oxidase subunit IV family protein [Bacteroidia bacterium]MCX7763686.1 cytochrome C oxidase subunit IV family protein [Bacteroidia bacterium]MDW8057033.1 cytochrome C oxidase subunit IV family protein [Bacteroidia bacterium]